MNRKGLTYFLTKGNYSLKARYLSVNGSYLSVSGKKDKKLQCFFKK